jgi:TRAP-type C4-dicarboxylate transport system substrate-binding protein
MKTSITKLCFAAALSAATALGGAAWAETTLKMATDSGAKGTPAGDAIERWASLIEEGTNGEVKVDLFYQNELGGQQEVFDLFVANEVQLMLNWPMTSYDERISLLYTPYMVFTWEEALDAYKPGGWVNGLANDIYSDLGLKYYGAWPEGFNGIATKGRYATNIADADGMKIRVPPVFPNSETVSALGYQTAAIDWGEVFTSIQTGVVDGDGGNVIFWDYEYFRDTLDYYTRTKHQFITGSLSANLDAVSGLSEEHQMAIETAAKQVMEEHFTRAREFDELYVQKAKDAGMTYVEPSDEEIAALAAAVREKVWPLMEKKVGSELMNVIRANASAN